MWLNWLALQKICYLLDCVEFINDEHCNFQFQREKTRFHVRLFSICIDVWEQNAIVSAASDITIGHIKRIVIIKWLIDRTKRHLNTMHDVHSTTIIWMVWYSVWFSHDWLDFLRIRACNLENLKLWFSVCNVVFDQILSEKFSNLMVATIIYWMWFTCVSLCVHIRSNW